MLLKYKFQIEGKCCTICRKMYVFEYSNVQYNNGIDTTHEGSDQYRW